MLLKERSVEGRGHYEKGWRENRLFLGLVFGPEKRDKAEAVAISARMHFKLVAGIQAPCVAGIYRRLELGLGKGTLGVEERRRRGIFDGERVLK